MIVRITASDRNNRRQWALWHRFQDPPKRAVHHGLAAVIAMALILGGTPAEAQMPASWNMFSVDLTLNRYEIGNEGQPAGFRAPVVTYRLERIAAPPGWKTVFTLVSGERQKVQTLKGTETAIDSLSVVRLEDDGDGTPIRVTKRDGSRAVSRLPVSVVRDGLDKIALANPDIPMSLFTSKASRPGRPAADRDWVDSIVASPGRSAARRSAIVGRFGGSTGTAQGLDRYEAVRGKRRIEVLIDPHTSVVVALNTFNDDVPLERTTIIYSQAPDGSLVRKGVRSEHRISADRRAVTEVEFSKVTFEQREIQ